MKHTLCGILFTNDNYKHNKKLWKIIHYPINISTKSYVWLTLLKKKKEHVYTQIIQPGLDEGQLNRT